MTFRAAAPRLLVAAALVAGAAPVSAAPGGPLGTMPIGAYRCELPGDAESAVGLRQPERDFAVVFGSGYVTATGRGIYLMTGDRVEFTSGPMRGEVFSRSSRTVLKRMASDGSEGPLRCVGVPNSGR
jgi:hypothetical protein